MQSRPSRDTRRFGAILTLTSITALTSAIALAHPGHDVGGGDPGTTLGGEFPTNNIEFLGQIALDEFAPGSRQGSDCWGYVSPSGREYGIMGLSDGFAFVEVTDPIQPSVVAFIPGDTSVWRDVKTYSHYAYGVSEAGIGIHVFDLDDIDNGNVTFVGAVTSGGGTLSTHNVAINEESGYLYRLAGGGGTNYGLRIYDLNSDPSNPTFVKSFNQFYIHDAQIVSFDSGPYAGREIAFCCSGFNGGGQDTRLRIVDVTDKNAIFEVGSAAYPARMYAHQGWLSTDRQYFYLNDELDEEEGTTTQTTTNVIDVSDLSNPVWVTSFSTGLPAIDHNLYVHENMIYETNYTSGLRVFDATDPLAPTEVAWFDTFPSSDGTAFSGAWSNYPYFPSGNIIVSDINAGLLVVRLAIDRIDFNFHDGLPEPISPSGCTNLHVELVDVGMTPDPATLKLYVEDSNGVTQYDPLAPAEPGDYDFWIGQTNCGDLAHYWIECTSTTGVKFTAPSRAPVETFHAFVSATDTPSFDDNCEADNGWSISTTALGGGWERGVPVNAGINDPPADADASGACYVTGNAPGDDVTEGTTTLTSPIMAMSTLGGTLEYAYWFDGTRPASGDKMTVQISLDGGAWANHEILDGGSFESAWKTEEIHFGPEGDYPGVSTVRVRFVVVDQPFNDNILEAGIDAVVAVPVTCSNLCRADLNGDGATDVFDFALFLSEFGAAVPACSPTDFDADAQVTVFDFAQFVADFGCGS